MKIPKYRRKKWEEMTDKQKIEYLGYISHGKFYPSGIVIMFIGIAMLFVSVIVTLIVVNNIQIENVYTTLNITNSPETIQKLENIGNEFREWFVLCMVLSYGGLAMIFISWAYNHWKVRPRWKNTRKWLYVKNK